MLGQGAKQECKMILNVEENEISQKHCVKS